MFGFYLYSLLLAINTGNMTIYKLKKIHKLVIFQFNVSSGPGKIHFFLFSKKGDDLMNEKIKVNEWKYLKNENG